MHRDIARRSVRCGDRESFSPLDEMDRAFLALARTSSPVRLSVEFREGAGEVVLPVDQVRARLAHPATPPRVRTRIWSEVVARAQRAAEPWSTVAVGMAVPALRRILSRLPRGGAIDTGELEQEVLTAFVAALRTADTGNSRVDRELLAAADRAAHRHVYATCRHAKITEHRPAALREESVASENSGGGGDEYEVLLRAVRAGVITCREAQVIGRSRLEGESMTALALERRMSRRHLYRYRADAEARLARFLETATP